MFIPKKFRSEDREVLKRIIDKQSFSLVISDKGKIRATHTMMMLNEEDPNQLKVEVHISNANPQAKELQNGDEVLLDFMAANTYISSSWYNHINASTWNYEAVQIYGKVQIMNHDELLSHLTKLTRKFEKSEAKPMYVENMGSVFVEKEMKGAFGFFVIPTEIDVARKLSQNRNDEDYANIINHLETRKEGDDVEIAQKMNEIRPSKG